MIHSHIKWIKKVKIDCDLTLKYSIIEHTRLNMKGLDQLTYKMNKKGKTQLSFAIGIICNRAYKTKYEGSWSTHINMLRIFHDCSFKFFFVYQILKSLILNNRFIYYNQ